MALSKKQDGTIKGMMIGGVSSAIVIFVQYIFKLFISEQITFISDL